MARKKAKPLSQNGEEIILGPVRPDAINAELGIIRAVEKETQDEKVLSLKRVHTEQVFDARMDVWNVHTDKNRYWVITNPTALYAQALFPSFDYALTFHVGLTYRTASNQRTEAAEKEQDQLALPWRRWEQAVVALDQASEAEEYQAVGILCRECLLSLIKTVDADEIIPAGRDRPRLTDFTAWSERIADATPQGPSAAAVRAYLKTIANAAWQFVDWLTHAADATRLDGNVAIEATEYVLMAFGAALLRHKARTPD